MPPVAVHPLLTTPRHRTAVWISAAAAKEFGEYQRTEQPRSRFIKKLDHFAKTGFGTYEGERKPIHSVGNGVLRVGGDWTLFRLLGFYSRDDKSEFVVMAAVTKRGQRYDAAERATIEEIARVRDGRNWQRVTP